MPRRNFLIGYKLLFSLLAFSSVLTEIIVIVGRGTFVPANFFSFFTIESNLFAATVLLLCAMALIKGKNGGQLDIWRGAATLYMATTGIVFAVLLAGLDVELTAVPWDNVVLHYIMPAALVIDWLIHPPKARIKFSRAAVWLVFPVVYVIYSLIRGAIVGWYPYPFLNPDPQGYGGVAVVSVGIAAVELSLAWLLTGLPLGVAAKTKK